MRSIDRYRIFIIDSSFSKEPFVFSTLRRPMFKCWLRVYVTSRRDNKFGLWPWDRFLRVDYIVNLDSVS